MGDMSGVIVPKSDQINADDLLSGPMTITITGVKVSSGQEQPVSMFFDGSTKAYRPCKSMARVLVSAWGADSSKYVGRSLTLYCDPRVKWGGMEVGGIRISHMSHLESPLTLALTMTRANKKPFTVRPMQATKPSTAPAGPATTDSAPASAGTPPGAVDLVSADQAVELSDLCAEAGMNKDKVLKTAGVESFEAFTLIDYMEAKTAFRNRIEAKARGSR